MCECVCVCVKVCVSVGVCVCRAQGRTTVLLNCFVNLVMNSSNSAFSSASRGGMYAIIILVRFRSGSRKSLYRERERERETERE